MLTSAIGFADEMIQYTASPHELFYKVISSVKSGDVEAFNQYVVESDPQRISQSFAYYTKLVHREGLNLQLGSLISTIETSNRVILTHSFLVNGLESIKKSKHSVLSFSCEIPVGNADIYENCSLILD